MPSIALGALSMATFARMARIAVVDELSKDYVRAGRARGDCRSARSLLRHVLRNAAIPVVTIAALEIGNLLAGAVIVETVFAWPGIGQLAIQSIQSRDFLVVQVDRAVRLRRLRRHEPARRHRLRAARPAHPAAQRMMSRCRQRLPRPRGRCRLRCSWSARSLRSS